MNSRKCDICNVDVHKASYAQHLRSKQHLENIKKKEMIIPELLSKEPIENKNEKIYNPKTLKQTALEKINLDDKQLNKELAKKIINPHYFADRLLQVGFNITLKSHHINHANSKLNIEPNYPNFGIEVRYVNKIVKDSSVIYARLKNQYRFKYQTVFSARIDKQDEDNQVLDETELFNKLNINHNLTETDIDNIDIKSPLEHHIQQKEMKYRGRVFAKISSMIIYFYKTSEMNGSSYVKNPLRSSAIFKIENDDKYCLVWSIFAKLDPYNNNHPNRVSNSKKYFNKLKIDGLILLMDLSVVISMNLRN